MACLHLTRSRSEWHCHPGRRPGSLPASGNAGRTGSVQGQRALAVMPRRGRPATLVDHEEAHLHREVSRRSVLAVLAAGVAAPAIAGCGGKSSPKDASPVSSAKTSLAAPGSPAAGDGPDILMIIRYAEKPTGTGAPYGATEAGEQDPESLIVDGWTRAGALVELFDPRTSEGGPAPVRPGLTRPVNVVVAADPGSGASQRPEETVTPLAAALGTSIDLKYSEGKEAAMVASMSGLSGPPWCAGSTRASRRSSLIWGRSPRRRRPHGRARCSTSPRLHPQRQRMELH